MSEFVLCQWCGASFADEVEGLICSSCQALHAEQQKASAEHDENTDAERDAQPEGA